MLSTPLPFSKLRQSGTFETERSFDELVDLVGTNRAASQHMANKGALSTLTAKLAGKTDSVGVFYKR